MPYIETIMITAEIKKIHKQRFKRKQPSKVAAVRRLKLEHRITALEKEMADIKRQLEERPKNISNTIHIQNISTESFKIESLHQHMQRLLDQRKPSRCS